MSGRSLIRRVFRPVDFYKEQQSREHSERTKEGLAGAIGRGVKLGRPRVAPEVEAQIRELRAAGLSLRAIAATLTEQGTETAQGSTAWWPSAVASVLNRHDGLE